MNKPAVLTVVYYVAYWILCAAVVGSLLFAGMPVRAGELYTVTTLRSYHVDRDKGYNEKNYGVGLEYQFNKTWSLAAGEYKNSFRNKSNYYGGAYTPFVAGDFKAGLLLLNVSGYDMQNERRYIPIAVPLIAYESRGWGVNTVFVPPVGNKTGVLGFQVKFNVVGF